MPVFKNEKMANPTHEIFWKVWYEGMLEAILYFSQPVWLLIPCLCAADLLGIYGPYARAKEHDQVYAHSIRPSCSLLAVRNLIAPTCPVLSARSAYTLGQATAGSSLRKPVHDGARCRSRAGVTRRSCGVRANPHGLMFRSS